MATVKAFRGLLPGTEKVSLVSAVPYDVVNSEEAAALAVGNPISFLRVSRPEIEMKPGISLYDDSVYKKAAENFVRLVKTAPLTPDAEASIYIYSLTMGSHTQTGVAAAFSVEEYNSDVIKKHEKTRKDKEDDRTRHILELKSHTGPVFLTYRDSVSIDAEVLAVKSGKPLFDFVAPDGVRHVFWRASGESGKKISAFFRDVPCFYIADGHHRAAAAARAAAEMRRTNPNHDGTEDYNFFLAVIFPGSQLRILPYNRIVKDLNGLSPADFKKAVQEKFTIARAVSASPAKSGEFNMFFEDAWWTLAPKFDVSKLGIIERLDVSVLQDYLLSPVLGITDPRTSKRIDFVGGIRGTDELEKHVRSGGFAVAFSMFSTTVEQLMQISDAGEIMPPKSTWFEPKLRDGIVCHSFN